MLPYEKIAKILRTDKDIIKKIDEKLSNLSGKKGILENIIEENKKRIDYALETLGILHDNMMAGEIYSALVDRIREDDIALAKFIKKRAGREETNFQDMIDLARETANVDGGFFLKTDKAKELILANPPQKILEFLGYSGAEELLEKEDIFEIFAGLRFIEDGQWLNNIFFKPYEDLTPDDFEKRDIQARALNEKWARATEHFLKKKYHNLSHLKELGFVFIIPVDIKIPGATLRNFSLPWLRMKATATRWREAIGGHEA